MAQGTRVFERTRPSLIWWIESDHQSRAVYFPELVAVKIYEPGRPSEWVHRADFREARQVGHAASTWGGAEVATLLK
ncbi:MAG: hypothetical protein AMXMBFR7_36700 [Planctomycetota bacterium]